MSPLTRLSNLRRRQLSTSLFIDETDTMDMQSVLYPRSTDGGDSSGGIQGNTIIFIVVGVVCLLVILLGFFFHKRNVTKSWRLWRQTSSTEAPATIEVPSVEVSFVAPLNPSPTIPPRAMTYPPIGSRPSQPRRVTSLSVTTSFSHSHITQEDLNNFRVSAYDLDGDLEVEMLNSARDDVWRGLPLALEEDYGDVGTVEAVETQSNVAHTVGGSVQGSTCLKPTPWKGGNYESSSACQKMACVEEIVVETVEIC